MSEEDKKSNQYLQTLQEKNRKRFSFESGMYLRIGYTRRAISPKRINSPKGFKTMANIHPSMN